MCLFHSPKETKEISVNVSLLSDRKVHFQKNKNKKPENPKCNKNSSKSVLLHNQSVGFTHAPPHPQKSHILCPFMARVLSSLGAAMQKAVFVSAFCVHNEARAAAARLQQTETSAEEENVWFVFGFCDGVGGEKSEQDCLFCWKAPKKYIFNVPTVVISFTISLQQFAHINGKHLREKKTDSLFTV